MLWTPATSGHFLQTSRSAQKRRGNLRLLCEVTSKAQRSSTLLKVASAGGVDSLRLRVLVVLEGKIKNFGCHGMFATRVHSVGRRAQPAVAVPHFPFHRPEENSVELLLLPESTNAVGNAEEEAAQIDGEFLELGYSEDDHVVIIELFDRLVDKLHGDLFELRNSLDSIIGLPDISIPVQVGEMSSAKPAESSSRPQSLAGSASSCIGSPRSVKSSPGSQRYRAKKKPLQLPKINSGHLTSVCARTSSKDSASTGMKQRPGEEEPRRLRRVPLEHIDCLVLPKPLDSLYLILDEKDRPGKEQVRTILASSDPHHAFAKIMVGDEALDVLNKRYAPGIKKLWHPQSCFSTTFAAMTALWSRECEKLKIGQFDKPDQGLAMLRLWGELRSLSYSDAAPVNGFPLRGLEHLEILELHDMGPDFSDLSECKLPKLKVMNLRGCEGFVSAAKLPISHNLNVLNIEQCNRLENLDGIRQGSLPASEIRLSKCRALRCVAGLVHQSTQKNHSLPPPHIELTNNDSLVEGVLAVAQAESVKWLDVSSSTSMDPFELLKAARCMKKRNGALVLNPPSPDGKAAGSDSMWAELQKHSEEGLRDKAERYRDEATEHTRNERFEEAIATLVEVKRILVQIRATDQEIDSIESQIAFVRLTKNGDTSVLQRISGCGNLGRWKRASCMLAGLGIRTPVSVSVDDAMKALVQLGFNRDAAMSLLVYVDTDRKGFITAEDLKLLFESGEPGSTEDMLEFYIWLRDQYGSIPEAFNALVESIVWAKDGSCIRYLDFQHVIAKLGWRKPNASKIFLCLDAQRRQGFLDRKSFQVLGFFAALHRMQMVLDLCTWLEKKYSSLERAFKAIDANNSCVVTLDELQEEFNAYRSPRGLKAVEALSFVDLNNNLEISEQEFLALKGVNPQAFLAVLQELSENILVQYSSFENAFAALLSYNTESQTNSCDRTLRIQEFVDGIANAFPIKNFTTKMDMRLFFKFLDYSQRGVLSESDFSSLRWFSVAAAHQDVGSSLTKLKLKFQGNPDEAFKGIKSIASIPACSYLDADNILENKRFSQRGSKGAVFK